MIKTIIYQKFVSRYADVFTMIERMDDETSVVEIAPFARTSKMSEDEYEALVDELRDWRYEKASWDE